VTENGLIGYSEPLRRFIQHEGFSPQVNEIPNEMPSWIPGDDYLTNFHKGDPFIKVEEGYARLPGTGYAALHPELEGVDPEDYPDIDKLRILGDVAPYSREYQKLHERRRLGPSPTATYMSRARTRRPPPRNALQSSWADFTTPQAGEHLIPDFHKHLRNTSAPWCIAASHGLLHRVLPDADNMSPPRHPRGHPVVSVPGSILRPGTLMTPCPT
jgi:hypothetical protein